MGPQTPTEFALEWSVKYNGQDLEIGKYWLFVWISGAEERPETIRDATIVVLPDGSAQIIFLPLVQR